MNNADEIVRALRTDAKWVKKISWQNAVTPGSAEFLEVSGRITQAADLIESLRADLERVTAERDAAVRDMYLACKTSPCNNGVCVKRNCAGNTIPCDFEWRGVKGEQE